MKPIDFTTKFVSSFFYRFFLFLRDVSVCILFRVPSETKKGGRGFFAFFFLVRCVSFFVCLLTRRRCGACTHMVVVVEIEIENVGLVCYGGVGSRLLRFFLLLSVLRLLRFDIII